MRKAAHRNALSTPSKWRHHALDLGSPRLQRAAGLVADTVRNPGEPLGARARAEMESRLGHDFSRIRVHTGELAARSADAVGARAYALGHSVVFNRDMYAPGSVKGQNLLAHELTHVVQQESTAAAPLPMVVQRMPIDEPESLAEPEVMNGDSESEAVDLSAAEGSEDTMEPQGGRTCGGSVGIPAAHHVTNFTSRQFNTAKQCPFAKVVIRAGWFSDFPTSEIGGPYMVTLDDPDGKSKANGTTRISFQGGDGKVKKDEHTFQAGKAGVHTLRIFSDLDSTLFLNVEGGSITPQAR